MAPPPRAAATHTSSSLLVDCTVVTMRVERLLLLCACPAQRLTLGERGNNVCGLTSTVQNTTTVPGRLRRRAEEAGDESTPLRRRSGIRFALVKPPNLSPCTSPPTELAILYRTVYGVIYRTAYRTLTLQAHAHNASWCIPHLPPWNNKVDRWRQGLLSKRVSGRMKHKSLLTAARRFYLHELCDWHSRGQLFTTILAISTAE